MTNPGGRSEDDINKYALESTQSTDTSFLNSPVHDFLTRHGSFQGFGVMPEYQSMVHRSGEEVVRYRIRLES